MLNLKMQVGKKMLILRKGKTKRILEGSVDSALLGVEIYNKPRTTFRSQGYIALMIIAWTRLFLAYFRKTIGEKYYYKKKNGRYEIVDDEKKAWDLRTCIKKYNNLRASVERNLEFFIGLRNKIEHRAILKSEIDNLVFGECQSLLYNYENILVKLFGCEYALHENLVYSLQFSHLRTEEQIQAHKEAVTKEMREVFDYVERYRSSLRGDVFNSQEYSIKLIQIPRISNTNRSDLAIEFVRWNELNEGDRKKYDKLHAIIKEKIIEKEAAKIVKIIQSDQKGEITGGALEGETQIVRIARDPSESEGILLHEHLSKTMVDEITNVVNLNDLLANGKGRFVFNEEIYYHIYSKRESVRVGDEQIELLAKTGFKFYAPVLCWLLRLPVERSAKLIRQMANDLKRPAINNVMRLAVLLGYQAEAWLEERLVRKWPVREVAPERYSAFDQMRRMAETQDRRLAALRIEAYKQLKFLDEKLTGTANVLLRDPEMGMRLLSKYCMYVSQGEKNKRGVCRFLDVMAYGKKIEVEGYKFIRVLRGIG